MNMAKIHRFDQFKHMDIFHKEIGYFLSVTEVLNVSKASEALGIRQSGLSRAIHRLEADLGEKLFQRKNNGLVLTTFGEKFLIAIKNTKTNWEENYKKLLTSSEAPLGLIKIGMHSSFGQHFLPQMLQQLHRHFPALEVEVHSLPSVTVVRKLIAHELDFGLVTSSVKNSELVLKVMGEDYLAMFKKNSTGVSKYILFNPETQMSNAILRKISDLKKIAIDDYDLLAKTAIHEAQLVLLPKSVSEGYPQLKQVGGALTKAKISLICQKDKHRTLAYKKLWDILSQSRNI